MRRSTGAVVAVVVALVVALGLVLGPTGGPEPSPRPAPDAGQAQSQSQSQRAGTVTVAELPPEAARTVELIRAGGPFPYPKDGATFGNREGLLPAAPRGTYREYTVPTPGSRDRGARRIVATKDGHRMWWSDDHYASFTVIDLSGPKR